MNANKNGWDGNVSAENFTSSINSSAARRAPPSYLSKAFRRNRFPECVTSLPVSYTHLDVYKRQGLNQVSVVRENRQPGSTAGNGFGELPEAASWRAATRKRSVRTWKE